MVTESLVFASDLDHLPIVFHRAHPAHHANLMVNYMVATELQRRHPDILLSNFSMAYWGIDVPPIADRHGDVAIDLRRGHHVDFRMLDYGIRHRLFTRINWAGWGMRLEYFPDLDRSRSLFSRPDLNVPRVDDGHLLCPVRGNEILDARHPGYTVIPVDFYSDLIERTGLTPVFMGQLRENVYTNALRERFPKAEYLPHRSPVEDFETIRAAANIAIPVSTFAWLSSWLSHAKRIYYPIYGIFNPYIFRPVNLLRSTTRDMNSICFRKSRPCRLTRSWRSMRRCAASGSRWRPGRSWRRRSKSRHRPACQGQPIEGP